MNVSVLSSISWCEFINPKTKKESAGMFTIFPALFSLLITIFKL